MPADRTFLHSSLSVLVMLSCCGCGLLLDGCTLDRSVIGCQEGTVGDTTSRCIPVDGGTDAHIVMLDGDIDAGPDANIDADMPDAMLPDGGDTDSGMDDAGIDDGGLDGGTDGGPPPLDGGTDAGTDAGPPPPLRIVFNAATGATGIAFMVVWVEGPPPMPRASSFYYHNCEITRAGAMVECLADAPELVSGRVIRFFPYDATAGSMTCTSGAFAACPSLCDRMSCPGYPPRGGFAYAASYMGMTLLDGEFTFSTDPGGVGDGPMPGDSAWLEFRLP